jgi:hypothetical protein
MTRFGEHAVTFAFTSDRFDHASELPLDYNAGNRLYGRDVAEFANDALVRRGLDSRFFDEDWGWQVLAQRDDGRVLEVSVYHDPDDGDDWLLLVRLLEPRRLLRGATWRSTTPRSPRSSRPSPTPGSRSGVRTSCDATGPRAPRAGRASNS